MARVSAEGMVEIQPHYVDGNEPYARGDGAIRSYVVDLSVGHEIKVIAHNGTRGEAFEQGILGLEHLHRNNSVALWVPP